MLQLDWNATINSIRESLPQAQFQNWFKPLQLIRADERAVVLGVPSRFHEEWLRSHYSQHLKQAIKKHSGGNELQLEFEILVLEENIEAAKASAPAPSIPPPGRPNLRIVDNSEPLGRPADSHSQPVPTPHSLPEPPNLPVFSHEFFELDYNHVAFQCVGMFAEGTNLQINPLILQGGVGMGKTHLLSEIGRRVLKVNPRLRVRYTNAENFTAEMVRGLKSGEILSFKHKYRVETDVLLFDDVQGISKRLKTQEELLHIFNDIVARGGRVAFTSSVPPHRLEEFIEPMKSRLLSGVIAEIRSPSFNDKVDLLTKMSTHNRLAMDPAVVRLLADKGQKDVRELIGTLVRVHLQAKIENKALDHQFLAQEGWGREAQKEVITMAEIITLVEHNFGICRTELVSKSRKSHTAWARQVAMYLARTYTLLPLEEIGKAFGRDHATVIHAFQKVTDTLQSHPHRRYEVEFLKQKLQNRGPSSRDTAQTALDFSSSEPRDENE